MGGLPGVGEIPGAGCRVPGGGFAGGLAGGLPGGMLGGHPGGAKAFKYASLTGLGSAGLPGTFGIPAGVPATGTGVGLGRGLVPGAAGVQEVVGIPGVAYGGQPIGYGTGGKLPKYVVPGTVEGAGQVRMPGGIPEGVGRGVPGVQIVPTGKPEMGPTLAPGSAQMPDLHLSATGAGPGGVGGPAPSGGSGTGVSPTDRAGSGVGLGGDISVGVDEGKPLKPTGAGTAGSVTSTAGSVGLGAGVSSGFLPSAKPLKSPAAGGVTGVEGIGGVGGVGGTGHSPGVRGLLSGGGIPSLSCHFLAFLPIHFSVCSTQQVWNLDQENQANQDMELLQKNKEVLDVKGNTAGREESEGP
ncbi:hypothetical protein Z043_117559 [Scleropages formosus]|uniref:Tropoelastin n=1 Tax=Scleropages formosus TaxID=113540 RepID=A0A0P7WQZ1_SCLFO|nr:hypothetical protein Z043_117559 [Scleropages formosus]